MMSINAIRGAITVDKDDKQTVLSKTEYLLKELLKRNNISTKNIISIIFTATKDISSVYPAEAARGLQMTHIPLICCQEMYVENSLPMCIRVMINVRTEAEVGLKHVYLGEAVKLRPDIVFEMDKLFTVAIDGPAGAGKSTIAKMLAEKLGVLHLDTGAMYRALALKALEQNINPEDEPQVEAMIDTTKIDVLYEDGVQVIYLDSKDITNDIRTEDVSKAASAVAVIPKVRMELVEMQRNIAMKSSLVMDGRDIGTYVLPDADLKIFLTASVEERAKRRLTELHAKGVGVKYGTIIEDIRSRDFNDSNREFAPLKKAEDAVLIDTTDKSIEQVIQEIEGFIKRRGQDIVL